MYEKFYGLKEPAFNLTPDPSFMFLNKRSKDAIDRILYSIERREGFAVIVGDIGTGKTTLCWALLERLARRNIRTALIQNPMLSELEILKSILQDLGVRPAQAESAGAAPEADRLFDTDWMRGMTKKQLLDRLNLFLVERTREDVFTVLIVDEAQNVSLTLLEQLRLLSNLETAKKKLLQIIFVGQLELYKKLKSSALRQLDQRISVRFETKTLSCEDTERYIHHRISAAGGAPRLRFARGAYRAIWRYAKGYPRVINLLCDRALLGGYMERSEVITPKLVRRAARDLQGMDDEGYGSQPGWFRRLVPYLLSAALLIAIIIFIIAYRGLLFWPA